MSGDLRQTPEVTDMRQTGWGAGKDLDEVGVRGGRYPGVRGHGRLSTSTSKFQGNMEKAAGASNKTRAGERSCYINRWLCMLRKKTTHRAHWLLSDASPQVVGRERNEWQVRGLRERGANTETFFFLFHSIYVCSRAIRAVGSLSVDSEDFESFVCGALGRGRDEEIMACEQEGIYIVHGSSCRKIHSSLHCCWIRPFVICPPLDSENAKRDVRGPTHQLRHPA